MSAKQSTITASGTSKIAVAALALVFVFGLFVVGFDQGHIFSLVMGEQAFDEMFIHCLLYTSPSPRDRQKSRMPSSA